MHDHRFPGVPTTSTPCSGQGSAPYRLSSNHKDKVWSSCPLAQALCTDHQDWLNFHFSSLVHYLFYTIHHLEGGWCSVLYFCPNSDLFYYQHAVFCLLSPFTSMFLSSHVFNEWEYHLQTSTNQSSYHATSSFITVVDTTNIIIVVFVWLTVITNCLFGHRDKRKSRWFSNPCRLYIISAWIRWDWNTNYKGHQRYTPNSAVVWTCSSRWVNNLSTLKTYTCISQTGVYPWHRHKLIWHRCCVVTSTAGPRKSNCLCQPNTVKNWAQLLRHSDRTPCSCVFPKAFQRVPVWE